MNKSLLKFFFKTNFLLNILIIYSYQIPFLIYIYHILIHTDSPTDSPIIKYKHIK